MRILYIGGHADQALIEKINRLSASDAKVSVAALKYSDLISQGLHHQLNMRLENLYLVPVGMYPSTKIGWFSHKKESNSRYIPFPNFLLIKQLWIALYVFFYGLRWYLKYRRTGEKKIILCNYIYLPFIAGLLPLKLFRKLGLATFVPDMPDYGFSYAKTGFSIKKLLVPVYQFFSRRMIRIYDFYIFITEYMRDKIPDKPYMVMEGLVDVAEADQPIKTEKFPKKVVMYAGALYEKFGIGLLLEAFSGIEGDYQLWIFGSGEMEPEIIRRQQADPRIRFMGLVANKEIIHREKQATLLINPRFSDNEFTKYSFPSKLMEYMVSGTPVLTTRLPGIPQEYDDKMYYFEAETLEGFSRTISAVMTRETSELEKFGENARTYILREKNNLVQMGKVIQAMDVFFSVKEN